MYSYANKGSDAGMNIISMLFLDHWDGFSAKFNELKEDQ